TLYHRIDPLPLHVALPICASDTLLSSLRIAGHSHLTASTRFVPPQAHPPLKKNEPYGQPAPLTSLVPRDLLPYSQNPRLSSYSPPPPSCSLSESPYKGHGHRQLCCSFHFDSTFA